MIRELARGYNLIKKRGILDFVSSLDELVERTSRHKLNRYRSRLKYRACPPGRYDIVWIDPAEVDQMVVPQFYATESHLGGLVIGGEWDTRESTAELMYANRYEDVVSQRCLLDLSRFELYNSLKEHFKDGTPWEDTDFYNWVSETNVGKYDSKTQIHDRLSQLDRLYNDIKDDGYKSQRKIATEQDVILDRDSSSPPEHNEIWVDITRDGRFVFEEGRHRFIIAKLAGAEKIPVRVFVRHTQWQDLREQIARGELEDPSYDDHPDIQTCA